ncbi:MAG TPA: hypothetical protein VFE58_06600 [Tepidisphaeraceae bacterium]|jgi:PHD/YefM family antitoxin component YafN of YafNO toxin-antitoxin module|nr:hypothetical protein [Tepidisphaeraceae bacterium]
MTGESFQIVDVFDAGTQLDQLHEMVVRRCGRVEMIGPNGESSVVISKTELESLERAIELLSATEDVRELCDAVADMARQVTRV